MILKLSINYKTFQIVKAKLVSRLVLGRFIAKSEGRYQVLLINM